MKLEDVFNFCKQQAEEGRHFVDWEDWQIIQYLVENTFASGLLVFHENSKIHGLVTFEIRDNIKEIWIKDIIVASGSTGAIRVMTLQVLFNNGFLPNPPAGWTINGRHKRTGRPRQFPLNLKTINRLLKL